jgi:hypothetical protein
MPYPPELLRHQIVAIGASLLLSVVGMGSLVYGLRSDDSASTAFVAFGAVSLLVGPPMAWLSGSWYRRAARLVAAGQPVAAAIALFTKSDFDSATLFAEVRLVGNVAGKPLRVAVLAPRWDYRSWLGSSSLNAGLFIEPSSSRLMAISTQRGMLWCIPHNASATA